jgi:hypothetical protein
MIFAGHIPILSLFVDFVCSLNFSLTPTQHIVSLQSKVSFYPHNAQFGCVDSIDIGD